MRVALGLLALSTLPLLGCKRSSESAPAPTKQESRPAVDAAPAKRELPRLIDKDGLASLLKAHKGQPVLVNVLASWCGPCRQELPSIEKLQRDNPRLFVLGIDVDTDEEALRAFLPTVPASFTLVRYPGDIGPLLPAFQLPADWNEAVPPGWEKNVPLTLVYDDKGEFGTGAVGQLGPPALEEIAKIAATRSAAPGAPATAPAK